MRLTLDGRGPPGDIGKIAAAPASMIALSEQRLLRSRSFPPGPSNRLRKATAL